MLKWLKNRASQVDQYPPEATMERYHSTKRQGPGVFLAKRVDGKTLGINGRGGVESEKGLYESEAAKAVMRKSRRSEPSRGGHVVTGCALRSSFLRKSHP